MDHVQLVIDYARNCCGSSGARLTLLQATDHVVRVYCLSTDDSFRRRVQERWNVLVGRGFESQQYATWTCG